jgi:aminopeptidase S
MFLGVFRSAVPLALAVAVAAACSSADPAPAPTASAPTAIVPETTELEGEVSVDNVLRTLVELQAIAQENGGNRAAGTPGYARSVDLFEEQLRAAGLAPQRLAYSADEYLAALESSGQPVPDTLPPGVDGENLIAEIDGETDEVLLIGAHLDSVPFGPGINDNGSGAASLLEVARAYQARGERPKKTIRFAFWGSEETGLVGSTVYANSLSGRERSSISAYVNFDMTATPDGTAYVVDGDKSTLAEMREGADPRIYEFLESIPLLPGSARVEALLLAYYQGKEIEVQQDLLTLSATDTAPFLDKTAIGGVSVLNQTFDEQTGELAFGVCYHQACDDVGNIDERLLGINLGAIANVTQRLAA